MKRDGGKEKKGKKLFAQEKSERGGKRKLELILWAEMDQGGLENCLLDTSVVLDENNMWYKNQGDWTTHLGIWGMVGLTLFNPNSVIVL